MEPNPSRPAALGGDHVVADQSAVFALLADPATHHLPPGTPVTRIDTHGAVVFLAGDHAYKVKRAVFFPFMDFSTLAKRQAACLAEVAISGANAPGLYLGVVAITRAGPELRLDGSGEVVEYAVHMRRFDTRQTLDRVASEGELSPQLVTDLAAAVARAHAGATEDRTRDAVSPLAGYLADNRAEFTHHPELFAPADAASLAEAMEAELARLAPLLQARGAVGLIRRCHGDLHLANIVLLEDRPVLFDAIEFSTDIATCDVLYDLAFLLMDLWQRGLVSAANGVLNHYLWARRDDLQLDGLAALPFFMALRACIRAKVEAAGLAHLSGAGQEAARRRITHLFTVARALIAGEGADTLPPRALPPGLTGAGPRLIAIGGLSGSGKTTRALEWAPYTGRAPGAVVIRSDVERKRMFGGPLTAPLPAEAYAAAVTRQVYAELCEQARRILATGQSVIVDAVHAHAQERGAIAAVAQALHLPFVGIWLEAPLAVRVERVTQRQGDASDADADVARRQQAYDLGSVDWLHWQNA
ncbi:bifunctional aminoglycoside phosphotransferase/ATP-binding protein [Xanthobacter sp. ZOL 2024]